MLEGYGDGEEKGVAVLAIDNLLCDHPDFAAEEQCDHEADKLAAPGSKAKCKRTTDQRTATTEETLRCASITMTPMMRRTRWTKITGRVQASSSR